MTTVYDVIAASDEFKIAEKRYKQAIQCLEINVLAGNIRNLGISYNDRISDLIFISSEYSLPQDILIAESGIIREALQKIVDIREKELKRCGDHIYKNILNIEA